MYRLNTKIRLAMLCYSGFELHSRWVPLNQTEKFFETGVIEKATHSKGEYISNIFGRPNKDGSYRLILNLKYLNEFVEYDHFKMENLKSASICMRPNCYTASIDLKDAYYSVSIDPNHRKYLRFK